LKTQRLFKVLRFFIKGLSETLIFAVMKYLIVGLGNIGSEYAHTRHNIGFDIADELVKQLGGTFSNLRLAYYSEVSYKGKKLYVIKPTTYMNLSGRAVNYWMQELRITLDNVLVLVDDLALPLGKLRLKLQGSSAGHNGLKSIEGLCGGQAYPRLRFGIGDNFSKGRQADYVLAPFDKEEQLELPALVAKSTEIIKSFVTLGPAQTMTAFNQ
jgi:PTH1 family peptidyl-tRNA hydrolase